MKTKRENEREVRERERERERERAMRGRRETFESFRDEEMRGRERSSPCFAIFAYTLAFN